MEWQYTIKLYKSADAYYVQRERKDEIQYLHHNLTWGAFNPELNSNLFFTFEKAQQALSKYQATLLGITIQVEDIKRVEFTIPKEKYFDIYWDILNFSECAFDAEPTASDEFQIVCYLSPELLTKLQILLKGTEA